MEHVLFEIPLVACGARAFFYVGSCGCGREHLSASLVFSSILIIGPTLNHDDLNIVGRGMKRYTYCFRTTPFGCLFVLTQTASQYGIDPKDGT